MFDWLYGLVEYLINIINLVILPVMIAYEIILISWVILSNYRLESEKLKNRVFLQRGLAALGQALGFFGTILGVKLQIAGMLVRDFSGLELALNTTIVGAGGWLIIEFVLLFRARAKLNQMEISSTGSIPSPENTKLLEALGKLTEVLGQLESKKWPKFEMNFMAKGSIEPVAKE